MAEQLYCPAQCLDAYLVQPCQVLCHWWSFHHFGWVTYFPVTHWSKQGLALGEEPLFYWWWLCMACVFVWSAWLLHSKWFWFADVLHIEQHMAQWFPPPIAWWGQCCPLATAWGMIPQGETWVEGTFCVHKATGSHLCCPLEKMHHLSVFWTSCWWVTLLIYTTIQSKLQWHLPPFLSSSPHHSQTANVSLQSVLPIIIINTSSNSIPLQLLSRWLLDSDDYDAHVDLWNQLHSQHPQLLSLAQLYSM